MRGVQDTIALVMPLAKADPHDSLRLGAQTYKAAFEEIGYRTEIFELSKCDRAMVDALRSPRIRAIFSDGGWINTVFTRTANGEKPLADVLEKPLVVLINDSPCSHWMGPILERDRPNQSTFFLDADFATLWTRWVDKVGAHQAYIPACPTLAPPMRDEDRSIDRLVVVSLRDPEHFRDLAYEHFHDDVYRRLFDGIAETALSNGPHPFSTICDEVCHALNVSLNYMTPNIRLFLYLVDYYIRNRRRQMMLDQLSRHSITLVGGGRGVRLHPDSRVMPPMAHAGLLNLYRQARSVIVSPPYSGAITERTVQPMAAGALVVAPPTSLSNALFSREFLFVKTADDFSDLDACLDSARDPVLRRAVTEAAFAFARRRFSPTATVHRFLGELDAQPLSGVPPT